MLFAVTALCLFLPVKLAAQSGQTVVNGSFTTTIKMPATGCSFQWSHKNTSIGLAQAQGTGDILPFKAINNTARPIIDTVTITSIPEHQFAYVGNSAAQTLSVINLVDNSIVTTLPINSNVYGTVITPDDKTVYTASEDLDFITVFDAVHNVVDHTISLPKPPGAGPATPAAAWGIALSKDDKYLYATNTTGHCWYAINLQTEQVTVLTPIPYGFTSSTNQNIGDIYTLLVSDDGTKIYSNLGVYDIATNAIVDTTGLWNGYDMVYSPDHSKIYTTNRPDAIQAGLDIVNNVRVYDVASRTYSTFQINAKGGFGNLAISPDGKTLYADNFFYDNVSVIDLTSQSLKGNISTGDAHRGIAAGLGGSRFYVINANGGVVVFDTKTLQITGKKILAGGTKLGFGKFTTTGTCYGEPTTYIITVEPTPPTINASGTLPMMQTVYGTPSVSASITVSGTNVSEGVLVSPPDGFEVSIDNTVFSNTITVNPIGDGVPPTQIYIRLKANSPAKDYPPGDVVISSAGNVTGSVRIATAPSQIAPAQLAISSKNINKTYGKILTVNADSTNFVAVGLQNGDVVSFITMTFASGGAATDPVRTYPGSASPSAASGTTFLASNYIITYKNSDLAVVPAPLTIIADNKSRVYDDPNPPLTLTYKGFVNGEDASQLSTLPSLTTPATILSAVGKYPIIAAGAIAANYVMAYVEGVFTIMPRPLILTNAITPNSDGINDTWEIKAIGQYPNCVVEIMNRYGQQVFYSVGYGKPWDGRFKGNTLPAGTYYYVISLGKGLKPVSGYLALIK